MRQELCGVTYFCRSTSTILAGSDGCSFDHAPFGGRRRPHSVNVRLGTVTECGSRARGFRREGLVVATRAREKMCAVNVSVEAVIASGPETLRSSQVGDAAATAAGREARAVAMAVTSWNDWCEEFIMHPDAEV